MASGGPWPEKALGKALRPCQQGRGESPEGEVGSGLKGRAEEARADRGWSGPGVGALGHEWGRGLQGSHRQTPASPCECLC